MLLLGKTGNQYDRVSDQDKKCKTWGQGVGMGQTVKASINNSPRLVKKNKSKHGQRSHTDEGGKL